MIFNAFLIAFMQIRRSFFRSFLSALGVIIGVASVVVMLNIGKSSTHSITSSFDSLGVNLITIHPSRGIDNSGRELGRKLFSIKEISGLKGRLEGYALDVVPSMHSNALVRYGKNRANSSVESISSDEHFDITSYKVASGRRFSSNEYEYASRVCILGSGIYKALGSDFIGGRILVGKIVCEVVGVLESRGQSMGYDMDDVVLMPFKTFYRDINTRKSPNAINKIIVSSSSDSGIVIPIIENFLRSERNVGDGEKSPFEVRDSKEFLKMVESATKTLSIFLGLIGGISLLVGGIGIMNVMLVSITERTREIGTRMAIGALASDVLLQFLIEAITISAIGGILGILLAFGVTYFICNIFDLYFIFDVWIAFSAFLFSVFIGVLFGYLPARKASKLNPIEALRRE